MTTRARRVPVPRPRPNRDAQVHRAQATPRDRALGGPQGQDAQLTRQQGGLTQTEFDERWGAVEGQGQGQAPAATPDLPVAAAGTTREQVITAWRTWLQARTTEVADLTGDDKVSRVNGLLQQVEDVARALQQGVMVDVARLDTRPAGERAAGAPTFVPPEIIAVVRPLIEIVEREVEGATTSDDAVTEGSRYSATDWNSRLGVPTYRNQHDNLVAGEATCNVTSAAMAYERLGISRAQVVSAIEVELKKRVLRARGTPITPEALNAVELPDNAWQEAVERYLRNANNDSANYRKVRGGPTTNAERTTIAQTHRDDAQLEDLLDLLVYLRGAQTRYEIVGAPDDLLAAVVPDAEARPTTEQRWTWDDATKTALTACLDAGGAAILSVYHKGSRSTDTHLVSVQRWDGTHLTVDDPYGGWRADYVRGSTTRDAYTHAGQTRATSGLRNATHTGDLEDWKSSNAQDLDDNERRGDGSTWTDRQVRSAFNRLTLYHRATPAADAE